MAAVPNEFDILPAPPALYRRALALALAEVPGDRQARQIDRLVAAASAGELDLSGLLIARQGAELLGAVWAQRQPGRVATVWAPVADNPAGAECAERLAASAVSWLARTDVRVAQMLVPTVGGAYSVVLQSLGFEPMADLLYMVSLAAAFPRAAPASPLEFAPAAADGNARLAALVERTYEGTLDCPRLNGVRDVHDVLAGYRASAASAPPLWFIARRDNHDVGCVLMADEPEEDQCEIVYAGLVPAARRRGLGRALVRYAQWCARQAGRSRLVLAVDAANHPAVKTYAAAGFQTWNRRSALVRIFPRGAVAT